MNDFTPKWPNAVAHVDADCFYVSCELLRNPSLRGKPVGVLSSQDACVVSKSYEAKRMGIKGVMTRWDAEKACPGIILIPADFLYYEQISRKMFSVIRDISPDVEIYSVDEGFVNLSGLRSLHHCNYGDIGELIRANIKKYIGITVSVGVSTTKTLAKVASEKEKPDGLTIVNGRDVEAFLKTCAIEEICGVGRNRQALLNKYGLFTALDFYNASQDLIRKLLGKSGIDLWYELHSYPVFPIELVAPVPKGVSRTSSLGRISSDKAFIWAKLCYHLFKLATVLNTKGLLAKRISFFLGTKSHQHLSDGVELPFYSDNFEKLVGVIRPMFDALFDPYLDYRTCGVHAAEMIKAEDRQTDVFGAFLLEEKREKLMLAVHSINKKYGTRTIEPGILLPIPKVKTKGQRVQKDILTCS